MKAHILSLLLLFASVQFLHAATTLASWSFDKETPRSLASSATFYSPDSVSSGVLVSAISITPSSTTNISGNVIYGITDGIPGGEAPASGSKTLEGNAFIVTMPSLLTQTNSLSALNDADPDSNPFFLEFTVQSQTGIEVLMESLSFDFAYGSTSTSYASPSYRIFVSTDNGSSFSSLSSGWNGFASPPSISGNGNYIEEVTVALNSISKLNPATPLIVRIVLAANSSTRYRSILIDNITVSGTLERIPGTALDIIVSHQHVPTPIDDILREVIYVADPAIALLPDGSYVIAHSLFGTGSGEDTHPTTKVFRSTDKGLSWQHITDMSPLRRASFFVHDGILFYVGSGNIHGSADEYFIVRKSLDNGLTWTANPDSPESPGVIFVANTGTPCTPAIHEGRVWINQGTRATLSGDLSADLMSASAWTQHSAPASSTDTWPAHISESFNAWTETQPVASPGTGVVFLPKINFKTPDDPSSVPHFSYTPHSALFKAPNTSSRLTFDPSSDFVTLPGTQKKFGIIYDSVSQRFYAITNTVLPKFANAVDSVSGLIKHELIRNTATLYSSSDLRDWKLEKILLHSNDVDHTAWQYFNFVIDGDNLALASRTAMQSSLDEAAPPRGHDSNILSFHLIENFRTLRPTHLLKIEETGIQRYEPTRHDEAPLGNFVLGEQPRDPIAIAQSQDSTIYIQQQNGILLSYDSHGNFLGVADSLPEDTTFSSQQILITGNSSTQCTWSQNTSGDWHDPRNWYYWGKPDTVNEYAYFGSAITSDSLITLDQNHSINALIFNSAYNYTIANATLSATNGSNISSGRLVLSASTESGRSSFIQNLQGHHQIGVPVRIEGIGNISISAGASLTFTDILSFTNSSIINLDVSQYTQTPLIFKDIVLSSTKTLHVRLTGLPQNISAPMSVLAITGTHSLDINNFSITTDSQQSLVTTFENGILSIAPSATNPESLTPDQLLAYAFSADEGTQAGGVLNHLPTTRILPDGTLEITFDPLRSDLSYEVQESTDLQTWTPIYNTQGNASSKSISVEATQPTTTPALFLRLKVSPNVQ